LDLGYDTRSFVVALTERDEAGARGAEVLLDALEHAGASAGAATSELAVLLDERAGAEVAREAEDRGFAIILAADDRSQERFVLAHDEDFGHRIEDLDPTLTAVRVRWHPDDAPEIKKSRALGLTKVGAWLHETDRALLIELDVPPTDADLASVDGDLDRYRRQTHPAHVRAAIRGIRELGVEADLWAVGGAPDAAEAAALGELVRDAGRDAVSVLLSDPAAGDEVIRACASAAAYRGVVFGPELWAAELRANLDGEGTREDAARAIGDRFAHIIDLYTAAQPA
jgi:myo-inositol catabolism protein IolC